MKKLFFIFLFLPLSFACAPPPSESAVTPVQIQNLNTDYAVGSPRLSFALFDGPEPLSQVERVEITAALLDDADGAAAGPFPAVSYVDYEIPYWIAYPELPQAGIWGITAYIVKEDGSELSSDFLIEVAAEPQGIAVGAAAPPSQNRTQATEPDLQKLSSGNDPNPALYQMTIAEAAASGKRSVVAFVTPGLCQTKWCAPVLESVEVVRGQVGDDVNFIHVEVYEDFQALTLVPEMGEWGLDTEPWVYVLAKDGHVAARFGGPLSPRELAEAVESTR